jgi:hypothetical protein
MGLSVPGDWRQPNLDMGEGPRANGLENHGCTDCLGCMRGAYGNAQWTIEYLSMEYARDVEVQTAQFRTTQENVVQYLKRDGRVITDIVFNHGIHDMGVNFTSAEKYVRNVRWLVDLYRRELGVSRLTFVTISHTRRSDGDKYPQTNDKIAVWNAEVVRALAATVPVFVVDVTSMTQPAEAPFSDHVHLQPEYYPHVASYVKEAIEAQTC